MIELFSGMAGTVFSKGLESFRQSKEFKNVRYMMRELACREARYNAELLQLGSKLRGSSPEQTEAIQCNLTCKMKDDVFQQLRLVPLPLSIVFDVKLEKQWWEETFDALKISNKKHRLDAASLSAESILIERAYHWASINKAFAEVGKLRGDRAYLAFLYKAVERSVGLR